MKVNAGQAPSTLIPEYIGSDFDKVITVADNMEAVTEVVDNLDHIKTIENNLGIINTVSSNIEDVVATGSNIETVKAVVTDMGHIKVVESNLENINTVADNITDVSNVSDNMDYVKDVAQGIEGLPVISYIGDEPPTQPLNGAEWFCTKDGRTYTWYEDVDSGQWVESSPQSIVGVSNTFALWKRSLAEAGYDLIGSFQDGCTVTSVDQVVLDTDASAVYQWKGTIPAEGKVIPANSTPATAGGVSSTAWIDRTDGALRNELADDNSIIEIGQSTAGNLGKRTAGSVFVTEAPFNADPTGVVDATAAINAALATGKNVYGAGIFKVSGPLTMSGVGQQLCINFPDSYILPYHDGDVVRMTLHSQGAHVVIRGRDALGNLTQPRTGAAGGAVVIGYNGGNCMTASVAGSYVHTFYGTGYVHEQGAMVDFTGAHAENCTLDGFQWTPNYDDNNHALISTTHAINCGRDGYSLLSTGNFVDNNNPRHHQFLNAKAFGCQRNFNIETHGNVGTVFSELGVTPDRFGPLAYGNSISVFETVASFLGWQDLGTRNTLYGVDNYNNWTARQQFSRKSVINSGHEGYLELAQSGDRAFSDVISGTSGSVSVTHGRGSAASRVDAFEIIQMLSGGGAISRIKTGSVVATPGSIAANSSYSASVSIEDAGAVAGDSLILTMSNLNTFSELTVSGYLHANGQVIFFIRNPTGSAINPGSVTIRWVVMRH